MRRLMIVKLFIESETEPRGVAIIISCDLIHNKLIRIWIGCLVRLSHSYIIDYPDL